MAQKELLAGDIKRTGVNSIDSLINIIKSVKEREKKKKQEIEKVKQLDLIKQAQLTNIETEIVILREEMTNLSQNWEKRIQQCEDLAAQNLAIIKRQDKLAVDLHQKNEVCQLLS